MIRNQDYLGGGTREDFFMGYTKDIQYGVASVVSTRNSVSCLPLFDMQLLQEASIWVNNLSHTQYGVHLHWSGVNKA